MKIIQIKSHMVKIVPMNIHSKMTSKPRSALQFRYSTGIHVSFPALILLNPYNHGFHSTFDHNHFIYSDYLLYTVTVSCD